MSKSKKKEAAAKRKKAEKKNLPVILPAVKVDDSSSPNDKPVVPDEVRGIETHYYPYDENLLDRSRTQWQYGDWQSLSRLDQDTLQHHPDRAKLAILAAAGHMQLGEIRAAQQFTRLAKEWGCSKKLISQILISGVYNSLGCASALSGQSQKAMAFLETAVTLGTPGGKNRMLAQARMEQQSEQLRLAFEPASLEQELPPPPISNRFEEVSPQLKQGGNDNLTFSPTAYAYYKTVSEDSKDNNDFLYIQFDAKTLPRSGLHYMKKTFSKVLEEHFSFCEWYQEPGCCKRMPCALTGYAQQSKKTHTARLRLTKSHDFALDDPIFIPMSGLRRIILVRNPLFLLTSWFALDQLDKHSKYLKQAEIHMEKIWVSHEPEVLKMAYQALDDSFVAPSNTELTSWLNEKTQYMLNFIEKWVKPALDTPQSFCQVVRYEEINQFIVATLNELYDFLPAEIKERIKGFIANDTSQFHPRQDPFLAPSEMLTAYISDKTSMFTNAANNISSLTPQGLFNSI